MLRVVGGIEGGDGPACEVVGPGPGYKSPLIVQAALRKLPSPRENQMPEKWR